MITGILTEGLIYGIMVLGDIMSFRILNFCDMTVDGAFPLGACVLAACLTANINPVLALLLAFFAGCLSGLATTLIYTKLKVPDLLSGILVMTMLYSINLRIMSNRANISLLRCDTLFKKIPLLFPGIPEDWAIVIFMAAFTAVLLILMNLFYLTDFGLTMGALGNNPQMVISQGVDPRFVRGIGICFGDGLAAVSGALFAMYQGFADVGSGTGVVVSGLASLMLGEFLIRSNKIGLLTFRVILGSILYRALMYFARRYGTNIGLGPNDLKFITGILIIICLIISRTDITKYLHKKISGAKTARPKKQ